MINLINANALSIPLADESVHAAVTSPPYYALRDYKTNGQLGLEKRADCLGWATGSPCGSCYICQMVAVFREVKRVLRKDGVCFLNIGDSYATNQAGNTTWGNNVGANKFYENGSTGLPERNIPSGLKQKDMMLIPQRLALALQADGWWVRSDIIWAKPNPMPESVTDRPTKSHEYIWLLAKSKDYFWDQEAVKEAAQLSTLERDKYPRTGNPKAIYDGFVNCLNPKTSEYLDSSSGRNLRTVWNIATQPYSGAHYATYPEELVLRCLKAATSERGCCPKCGKMWEREVERENESNWEMRKKLGATGGCMEKGAKQQIGSGWSHHLPSRDNTTLGFRPSCAHDLPPIPATILDPFAGSGTTLLVAKRMGLSAIGLDLSYQYLRENAWKRIGISQEVLV
jgi:DNA modification methylase